MIPLYPKSFKTAFQILFAYSWAHELMSSWAPTRMFNYSCFFTFSQMALHTKSQLICTFFVFLSQWAKLYGNGFIQFIRSKGNNDTFVSKIIQNSFSYLVCKLMSSRAYELVSSWATTSLSTYLCFFYFFTNGIAYEVPVDVHFFRISITILNTLWQWIHSIYQVFM